MMYSAKVINQNHRRRGILVPEVTTFHHDSFVTNYELSTGTPLGAWWNYLYDPVRVPTALNIFRDHGVAAVIAPSWYGYELVRISDYQAHNHVTFDQIKHYVRLKHPVLVTFPVRSDYAFFPPALIYSVMNHVWEDDTHMVMVCGCGMWSGYPYLVYLNTFGWWWGQNGVGRVFWNQVLQWPGTQHVVYTLEMDGVAVPAHPPPPAHPDSPHPPVVPPPPQPSPPQGSPPPSPPPPAPKVHGASPSKRRATTRDGKSGGTKKAKTQY